MNTQKESGVSGAMARAASLALACWLLTPALAAADERLDAARVLWAKAALGDYEYGYQKFCDCHREAPPETLVSVRDGAVAGVRHRPAGFDVEVPAEERNFDAYWTIEELFGVVESALARGVTVSAAYHETLGYPTQIYVDYDGDFVGDELDLRLTRVQPLVP